MISRVVVTLMALVAPAAMAAADADTSTRDLRPDGINLCAAYDIVAVRIPQGYQRCECVDRTIVCKYTKICDEDEDGNVDEGNCASLNMHIDFSDADGETISYDVTYSDENFEPVNLVLAVDSDPAEGITSCTATYGEDQAACTCTVCGDSSSISLECGAGASMECSPVDLENFGRFVPFFEGGAGQEIVRSITDQQANKSGAISTAAFSALALAGGLVALAV